MENIDTHIYICKDRQLKRLCIGDHNTIDNTFIVKFKHSPTNIPWLAVKRILHYLYGTLSFDLNLTRKSDRSLSLSMVLLILIGLVMLKDESILIVILIFLLGKK
jgi:hypothetical protein